MPYYEVKVICNKCVCVKADNETEAEHIAADEFAGDWHHVEGVVMDEYDENNPKHMEFVQEYRDQHEYFED